MAVAVFLTLVSSAAVAMAGHPAVTHRATASPNASLERVFAESSPPLQLPAATAPPAPASPTLAAAPPLQSHEVFAFAPWWNLASSGAFDVKALTTLAYFSVDVKPDGSIDRSGSGWVGYQSQALADLITRGHQAGDRVVLTATCFDQQTLNQLTSNPSAPARLGAELVSLISAKNLDGVNLDFEGQGPQDRAGLDNLVAQVSRQLRAADPHWQISMSTYASSAGDPNGFYDIAGLNRSVDAFFVMAYGMDDPASPSATSPLSGSGNNDNVDLAEYEAVVPASKVILGVPYYGYDWPTAGPQQGSPATGPPTPVTYAQVAALNSPVYWDRSSNTPWTAYLQGSQWHQVWFDNPTSLALKARLANSDHVAGVGVWALGMDGDNPAMLAALLGNAAPQKFSAGPSGASASSPTSSTAAPSSAYSYTGQWNNTSVTLDPADPSTLSGGGSAQPVGNLSAFWTNNPAYSCLSSGKAMPVYRLTADPSTYVVQVATPGYCASGTWEFKYTAPPPSSTSSSSPSSSTTTTTTSPGVTVPPLSVPSSSTTSGNTSQSTTTTQPWPQL